MSYLNITKERAREILNQYKKDKDLFNWCREYNEFVNRNVLANVSAEWDYMIKKSYEDNESPVSYEDLNIEPTEEEVKERVLYYLNQNSNSIFVSNLKKKVSIKSLEVLEEDEDLKSEIEKAKEELRNEKEVYEWWIIRDPLMYRLEQQGEVFLNGAWGRQTTGQSIVLDSVVINAFISWLEDNFI